MTHQPDLLPDDDIVIMYPVHSVEEYNSYEGLLAMIAAVFELAEIEEPEWLETEEAEWYREVLR
jgi:hypothetical protein